MKEINEEVFSKEIKKAHIICSSDHGYLISLHNNNPYTKLKFRSPNNSQFFFYENRWGNILKLTQNKKTKIMAFQLKGYLDAEGIFNEELESQ